MPYLRSFALRLAESFILLLSAEDDDAWWKFCHKWFNSARIKRRELGSKREALRKELLSVRTEKEHPYTVSWLRALEGRSGSDSL